MSKARVLLAVAVVGAAGLLQAQGTAKAEDVKLANGSEVRIASGALAAGWHEGTVTTAKVSNSKLCYGVSIKMPNTRTGKAVALFEGVDSIEVKVKLSDADKAAKKSEWMRIDAKSLKDKYPGCPKNP